MPFISAQEYLSYRYDVLNEPALLPLPDEPFTALWKEAAGERTEVYQAVDRALDIVEAKVAELCQEKASDFIILTNIICDNILK
jgi:hypothetical protein